MPGASSWRDPGVESAIRYALCMQAPRTYIVVVVREVERSLTACPATRLDSEEKFHFPLRPLPVLRQLQSKEARARGVCWKSAIKLSATTPHEIELVRCPSRHRQKDACFRTLFHSSCLSLAPWVARASSLLSMLSFRRKVSTSWAFSSCPLRVGKWRASSTTRTESHVVVLACALATRPMTLTPTI